MRLLFPELVKDVRGVYQPLPPTWVNALLLVGGVVAGMLITLSRGGPWMSFGVLSGLAAGFGVRSLLETRRHGPYGRPLVHLADGMVTIRQGDKGARDFVMPVAQVAHLVIYGPSGHRTYRFIRHDGSWCEARPQWKPKAEALVIGFLLENLSGRVVVEEPQTGFAVGRGDGPYFGS